MFFCQYQNMLSCRSFFNIVYCIKQLIFIQKIFSFIQLLILWMISYFTKQTILLSFHTFYFVFYPRQHFFYLSYLLKKNVLFIKIQKQHFKQSEINKKYIYLFFKNYLYHNHIQKMKFIVKSGSSVKLYSGQMNIQSLVLFLKENFPTQATQNLTYTDKDGDKISVTTQEDLEALKEINQNSQYLRLQFAQTEIISQTTLHIQKTILSPQLQKEDKKKSKSHRKSNKKSPKKEQQYIKESKGHRRGKWHREERKSLKSHQKDSSSSQERKSKIDKMISQQLSKLVDERIKSMIPCIKNQIDQNFENLVHHQNSKLVHEGFSCNGCTIIPISGIRYKCIECTNFNLCQVCQQKIDHEHNLLKMKKAEPASKQSRKQYGFYKLGKKLFKQIRHHHHRNSSSQSANGDKHGHGHRRHHGFWRNGKGCPQKQQFRFNKKMMKLQAMFGQRENFKSFIQNHPDLRCRDLIDVYATENNIAPEQYQAKRDKFRKEKLAAFYDCPEQQFDEVIKENPKLNFREIIQILKETGKRTHNGQNFKRMREKLRYCKGRKEQEDQKKVIKKSSQGKLEKKSKSRQKSSKEKGLQMKEKGKILSEMKELFGDDNGKNFFQFIQANYQLGKQGIIQKWIQKLSQ